MDLHSPNDRPFGTAPRFSIALGGTPDQTHVGVMYQGPGAAEFFLLHLGFHHRLYREAPAPETYCWAECAGFDGDELAQLSVWCNSIWRANGQRVPYGISFSSSPYFDSSGNFIPGREGLGLTCATFVMALLRDYGHAVVDTASWQRREEDEAWQRRIVDTLKQHKDLLRISEEHIAAQEVAIGQACRFRPEEVAACACLFNGEKVSFDVASNAGAAGKAQLFRLRARGCVA